MSLAAYTWVWKHSRNKGGTLLVELAIADYADDTGGHAWPSVESLAQKARMSERNVRLQLAILTESGELSIEYGGGYHGTNLYQLHIGSDDSGARPKRRNGRKSLQGGKLYSLKNRVEEEEESGATGRQSDVAEGGKSAAEISPDPSDPSDPSDPPPEPPRDPPVLPLSPPLSRGGPEMARNERRGSRRRTRPTPLGPMMPVGHVSDDKLAAMLEARGITLPGLEDDE